MATYTRIVDRYQEEFSNSEVKLAFTSEHIRRKVAEKEGIAIPSPLTALADLQDHGHGDVAVQSRIVPEQFHETVDGQNALEGTDAWNWRPPSSQRQSQPWPQITQGTVRDDIEQHRDTEDPEEAVIR
jgi:hypothetical protein